MALDKAIGEWFRLAVVAVLRGGLWVAALGQYGDHRWLILGHGGGGSGSIQPRPWGGLYRRAWAQALG